MQDPTLFVIRIWTADGFRASVRRVDDEDTHFFRSADEVASYLEISCAARAQPGNAAAAAPRSPDGEEQ